MIRLKLEGASSWEDFYVESNLTLDEVKSAYSRAVRWIGVDLMRECDDYAVDTLSEEFLQKLRIAGWENYIIDSKYGLDTIEYINIYLWMCKFGDQSFEYRVINLQAIDIGGYGLFSY